MGFTHMVLSWAADTPAGASTEPEARVLVDGRWSKWLSWGTWSASENRSSGKANTPETSDELAYVDVDTLIVQGESKTASDFQIRLTLNTSPAGEMPNVKSIAVALRNIYKEEKQKTWAYEGDVLLDVPMICQYDQDPSIASRICSPTSVAMVLKFFGVKVTPEEVALGVYDSEYDGFGNWCFNTAYAASKGLNAYVAFLDGTDAIKKELYKGNPVITSVKYRNSETVDKTNLPVLTGAPIPHTQGHLVTVRGFVMEAGRGYFIVNDPAGKESSKYLEDEFDKAWPSRAAYVITKN